MTPDEASKRQFEGMPEEMKEFLRLLTFPEALRIIFKYYRIDDLGSAVMHSGPASLENARVLYWRYHKHDSV